jgi:hypothetical protein
MTEILTINDLRETIDRDSNNHRIKEFAELFWIAMNDWPTYNQTNVQDFINELYDYFGFPLTIDKINNKKHDLENDMNTWRHESGSSIAEIIDISTRFENEPDFEKTLNKIVNYVSNSSL